MSRNLENKLRLHYADSLIVELLENCEHITISCEGEIISDDSVRSRDADKIVKDMFEVDECVIECKKDGATSWILYTHWNNIDESICDHTCGPSSEWMVPIIDEHEKLDWF